MQGHFWHIFLIQFFMLFHKVVSVFLSMVAFSTTFLLVQTIQQPIRIFEISGYWSYHGEQNAGYHVKEHRKLYQKQVSKVTLHFVSVLRLFFSAFSSGWAHKFCFLHRYFGFQAKKMDINIKMMIKTWKTKVKSSGKG